MCREKNHYAFASVCVLFPKLVIEDNICLIDISPAESGHVSAHLMPEMIRHGDNLGLGPLHPGPGPGPVIDGETLLWHVYNVMLAAAKLKYSL